MDVYGFQIYKSTGDATSARKMFDHYSAVNNDDKKRPWWQSYNTCFFVTDVEAK